MSVENNFFKDIVEKKNDRVILALGMKGSGKTFLLLNFIKLAFKLDLYDDYHLILPSYKFEQKDSYKFIKETKNKHITVYNKYHEIISKKLMKKIDPKKRVLLAIDDATSQLSMVPDEFMKDILTLTRHARITIYICAHVARREVGSMLRSTVDYVFFYRVPSDQMVEKIWCEWFSRFPEFRKNLDGFSQFIHENIDKVKHNGLAVDLREHEYSADIAKWHMQKLTPTK